MPGCSFESLGYREFPHGVLPPAGVAFDSMRRALSLALAVQLFAVLAVAACGGGDDDAGDASTASDSSAVSDEQYLKVICTGTQGFSDALISQTTAEGIAKSITDFIASLKATAPPADLQQFHKDLIKYLEDSVSDPTSLVTKKRPQPPDKARDRLASKEASVTECAKARYFVPD